MNNEHTIQGIQLHEITWRVLYNIMNLGGTLTDLYKSQQPDTSFGIRQMKNKSLLVVTAQDPVMPDLTTWQATDKLQELWLSAEDEIKTLLEI